MRVHAFDRVEAVDEGYVLLCACGWRSSVSGRAEEIGSEWDLHRQEPAH